MMTMSFKTSVCLTMSTMKYTIKLTLFSSISLIAGLIPVSTHLIPYKMLGMLIPTALPCTPNAWKIWVDHIMKQKKVYGFKKAAIAHENGMTTSATPGLILPIPEIQVNSLI